MRSAAASPHAAVVEVDAVGFFPQFHEFRVIGRGPAFRCRIHPDLPYTIGQRRGGTRCVGKIETRTP